MAATESSSQSQSRLDLDRNQDRTTRIPKVLSKVAWADSDGDKPRPLDARFVAVKKRLVRPEHYDALQGSWGRLLKAMSERIQEIHASGPESIPTINFAEITSEGVFPGGFAELARKRGCCIVKNVVTESQALQWKEAMVDYCARHPDIPGYPAEQPQIWRTYWTKPQLEARSHPSMIACQISMSQLYSAGDDVEVDLKSQTMYADRFRVRPPGTSLSLPPHLDNGSIERWEDEEYSAVFQKIWIGKWEEYDAWDMTHRCDAVIDRYGGPGACSAFRSIQGWLSLAQNGPGKGTIQLLPDIRLSTAYLLLRPFFDDNGKLAMNSRYFYGADPGMGQVVSHAWHPDLHLEKSLVSVPEINPADYVFWHCDMVHTVEEHHGGNSDSSVAYIPVVPLCKYNIGNLVEQRKAFLAGHPPPDMPPHPGDGIESAHPDRGVPEDILTQEGRRMLGLTSFDTKEDGITPGQRRIRESANKRLGLGEG